MAADINKNSAPDSEETGVIAKVGDGGQTTRHSRFKLPKIHARHIRKKPLFITFLVLVVIAVAAIAVTSRVTHIGQKVYAQAAGHKVYESDIKQIIGSTKGVTNRQAATVLADKYLSEAMGKQDNVSVSNQDLETAYGKDALSLKKSQPFYYQQNVNSLYFKKLATFNQSGLYTGEYLIANFSANVPYSTRLLAEQQAGNPTLGNPQAIAADKKYADDLLTKLYNQIVAHKITFAQAINQERNDPRVGVKAYPTQPHSGSFDTTNGSGSVIYADATRTKLPTIKQGTTTKPFVAGGSNILAGPYYLVIRMDKSKGGPGLQYSQFLQQAKQKFGYKVYV